MFHAAKWLHCFDSIIRIPSTDETLNVHLIFMSIAVDVSFQPFPPLGNIVTRGDEIVLICEHLNIEILKIVVNIFYSNVST